MATWNIESWRNRDQELLLELENHKIDICSISETRKKGKGSVALDKYILFYSGVDKSERANAGVGILIRSHLGTNVMDAYYMNERIMMIKIALKNNILYIISIYAPQTGRPRVERESFYSSLQELLDSIPKNNSIMIMGDFNAHIGNTVIPGIKQRFNDPEVNDSGDDMMEFCVMNELCVTNTFFDHKPQHKTTWINSRGRRSTIDFVLINKKIRQNQVLDIRTLTSANIGTDHGMVLCKINLEMKFIKKQESAKVEMINTELLEDPTIRNLYQARLNEKIRTTPLKEDQNVEEMWEKIKNNLRGAAREALGTRKVSSIRKQTKTPWFTEEIRSLAKEKKDAFITYKRKPSEEEYNKYKEVRNRINEEIRKHKEGYWEGFTKGMEYDLYGTQKRIWKMLQKQKKNVNEYTQVNHISKEDWVNHHKAQHNQLQTSNTVIPETDNKEKIDIPMKKLRESVTRLKNRKTPGPDGITNEMIKYGGDSICKQLHMLFNKILECGRVPLEWKNSTTVPIYKKGDRKDLDNYRGITLLNTTMKLFTSIMRDWLQDCIEIAEEQQGFRNNRGTTDAIFMIRQIREKAIEYCRPAFICFIDLTKAFDRIKKQDVIDILGEEQVNTQVIRVIRDMYENTTTRIRTTEGMTEDIMIGEGIRQGDSISPLLFNLIMDRIIKDVAPKAGYQMGRHSVNIICYADDVTLIANNEDDLQRLVHQFNISAKRYNMQISKQKTKCMVISKEPIRCKIQIDDAIIQQVMQFNYLGVEISSNQNIVEETKSQTTRAGQMAGCLRDTVWKNKYMGTEAKVKIYKAMVRPVLTYATEVKTETKRTKQKIRTTEMKVLRNILGVTLRDKQTNKSIRERCDVQDVVKWSKIRKKKWKEHVERMNENRLARICMTEKPTGGRPPGRPPKRWTQSWLSSSTE